MQQKFFLYARKSTDVEDKQILSIETQLTELRAYARQEGLNIVEEFVEKKTAYPHATSAYPLSEFLGNCWH
jgi:DNA invertase Pin-like site-specific DNA recombinase